MNKVLLVGRIANDINESTTQSGINYVRFTVAVSRRFTGQNNQGQTADFIPIVAWRNTAQFVSKFASKGARISVEGRFSSSTYQKDGNTLTSYEVTADNVELLETKVESESRIARTGEIKQKVVKQKGDSNNVSFEKGDDSKGVEAPWELDL